MARLAIMSYSNFQLDNVYSGYVLEYKYVCY